MNWPWKRTDEVQSLRAALAVKDAELGRARSQLADAKVELEKAKNWHRVLIDEKEQWRRRALGLK